MIRGAILAGVTSAFLWACSPSVDDPQAGSASATTAVEEDEDVNLDLWLERLEVSSRELYSARQNVVDALDLPAGAFVADIGAGTGLYSLMFAEKVGAKGAVFSVDIEPLFLDLINRRSNDTGVNNVTAVLGRDESITLPNETFDVVFIADTYHYFSDREALMTSVLAALKPGGALVIVDYDIIPGTDRPADKSHVRFGKASVIAEVEYIGFKFVEAINVDGLSENYFIRFEKPSVSE